MGGLSDLIIERRMAFFNTKRAEIKKILPKDPQKAFKKLMMSNDVKDYIKKAKDMEWFRNLHDKVGKTTLKNLRPYFFKSDAYHNDSIERALREISASIDFYFAMLSEGLATFPLFFTEKKIEEFDDINCSGKALIIPVLYSFDGDPFNDLRVRIVHSTKRLEKVLDAIDALKRGENIIIDKDSPTLADMTRDALDSEESMKNLIDTVRDMRVIYIDVDTFHGIFHSREELIYRLMEHALTLDYFKHVEIYNRKTGEVYDYKLESTHLDKDNYVEYDLERGLTAVALNAFGTFFPDIHNDLESIEEAIKFFDEMAKKHKIDDLINIIITKTHLHSLAFDLAKNPVSMFIHGKRLYDLFYDLVKNKGNTQSNFVIVAHMLNILSETEAKEIIVKRFRDELAWELVRKRYT